MAPQEKGTPVDPEVADQLETYYMSSGSSVPMDVAKMIEDSRVTYMMSGTLEPGQVLVLPEPGNG